MKSLANNQSIINQTTNVYITVNRYTYIQKGQQYEIFPKTFSMYLRFQNCRIMMMMMMMLVDAAAAWDIINHYQVLGADFEACFKKQAQNRKTINFSFI